MSDFGGLGGAFMLGQQLETYRWEDHFRRAREGNALSANDAAWRNHYNNLQNQYNRLLHDANRLADIQDRALNGKDAQIAELKAANDAQRNQIERLAVELADARADVNLLKLIYRESNPEVYRSIYGDE